MKETSYDSFMGRGVQTDRFTAVLGTRRGTGIVIPSEAELVEKEIEMFLYTRRLLASVLISKRTDFETSLDGRAAKQKANKMQESLLKTAVGKLLTGQSVAAAKVLCSLSLYQRNMANEHYEAAETFINEAWETLQEIAQREGI